MSSVNQFWMVYVDGWDAPKRIYGSLNEARAEASRLAIQEKARCFVLQSLGWFEMLPVPTMWQTTDSPEEQERMRRC